MDTYFMINGTKPKAPNSPDFANLLGSNLKVVDVEPIDPLS